MHCGASVQNLQALDSLCLSWLSLCCTSGARTRSSPPCGRTRWDLRLMAPANTPNRQQAMQQQRRRQRQQRQHIQATSVSHGRHAEGICAAGHTRVLLCVCVCFHSLPVFQSFISLASGCWMNRAGLLRHGCCKYPSCTAALGNVEGFFKDMTHALLLP